jgi:hypothetical protein
MRRTELAILFLSSIFYLDFHAHGIHKDMAVAQGERTLDIIDFSASIEALFPRSNRLARSFL